MALWFGLAGFVWFACIAMFNEMFSTDILVLTSAFSVYAVAMGILFLRWA